MKRYKTIYYDENGIRRSRTIDANSLEEAQAQCKPNEKIQGIPEELDVR